MTGRTQISPWPAEDEQLFAVVAEMPLVDGDLAFSHRGIDDAFAITRPQGKDVLVWLVGESADHSAPRIQNPEVGVPHSSFEEDELAAVR